MSFSPFSLGSYVIDSALLWLLCRRAGPRSPSLLRRGGSLLCLLALSVLYSSWVLPVASSAALRFMLRFVLNTGVILLGFQIASGLGLYLAALLANIFNFIHGFFLTSLTQVVQLRFDALAARPFPALLQLLGLLALRGLICFLIYRRIEPEKISRVGSGRVLVTAAVTAIGLTTRTVQFQLLGSQLLSGAPALNIYFLALLLALLLALVSFEKYQMQLQESRALQSHQLMAQSLLHTLELRKENDEAVRRLRHDLKNHMLSIGAMIDQGQPEQARAYIDSFLQRSAPYELRIQTGRSLLDALMSEKLGRATEEGIAVSVVMDFRAGDFLSDFDLCMLMGNALDNALEACRALPPESDRFIEVKGGVSANLLTVRMVNSCPAGRNGLLRTTKADPQEHGYGLRIIRDTAARYGGVVETRTDSPGRFTLLLSIPVPDGKTD